MKLKQILVLLLAGPFFGCGDDSGVAANSQQYPGGLGACAQSVVLGTWDFGSDIIGFQPDCTFFMEACVSRGTYEPVSLTSGIIRLKYETSLGLEEGCIPGGYIQLCQYVRGPDYLDLDCPPME